MRCTSQHTKRIFEHVPVMEASSGWRMGVVERIGIILATYSRGRWKDGIEYAEATKHCPGQQERASPWGRTSWDMRVTPAWAVMGCSPAGYEHGGQSLMGPSASPKQARGAPGPHTGYSQQEKDPGPESELDTRLQHGSKVHPRQNRRCAAGWCNALQANNLHWLIFQPRCALILISPGYSWISLCFGRRMTGK